MFAEYIRAALRHAKYEVLEDGTYMATVKGLRGVIAVGDTIEDCRERSDRGHRRLGGIGTASGPCHPAD